MAKKAGIVDISDDDFDEPVSSPDRKRKRGRDPTKCASGAQRNGHYRSPALTLNSLMNVLGEVVLARFNLYIFHPSHFMAVLSRLILKVTRIKHRAIPR